jgi:hypothetical protein
MGLTHLSQLQAGSNVALPIVEPFLKVVNSNLSLSNVQISSDEFVDFFSMEDNVVVIKI